jgi:hypothetical protein
MAITLSGTLKTTPSVTYAQSLDAQTVTATVAASTVRTQSYATGTGANQAQHIWIDERSLATTTSETLDLTALAGGAFGTITAAKVKEIIVELLTTTAGYRLLVGAAASNAFDAPFSGDATAVAYVGAGGHLHLSNPVDGYVVDGTHKSLKIENPSGGTASYRITVICTGSNA